MAAFGGQLPAPPLCELTDVTDSPREVFVVNTKFLEPGSLIPMLHPHGEFEISRRASLLDPVQQSEHSGCSSGRLRAILMISENCSTGCLTPVPRHLVDRPLPRDPAQPQPLRSDYPPMTPAVSGFLTPQQEALMEAHVREMLKHLTRLFAAASHAHSL